MKNFLPIITINNKSETKEVEINGEMQEVEILAQQGFNIKTRDEEGNYNQEYFVKDLEGIILYAAYQIQSKFKDKQFFMSGEFTKFKEEELVVFSPTEKRVLFKGDYAAACDAFADGTQNKLGKPNKRFDVYTMLYTLFNGNVYRFMWKMNQNNNWFDYKKFTSDQYGNMLFNQKTLFNLEKKTAGKTTFWACQLAPGEATTAAEKTEAAAALKRVTDMKAEQEEAYQKSQEERAEKKASVEPDGRQINVDEIPF